MFKMNGVTYSHTAKYSLWEKCCDFNIQDFWETFCAPKEYTT